MSDCGNLNLPEIMSPSFNLELSGTGRYANDERIVVESLVIDGESFAPGIYRYTNFTATQRAHLLGTDGIIIVSGYPVAVQDGSLKDTNTWGGVALPVELHSVVPVQRC